MLDGRDIGTVICPDAEVKIFVTASAAARAQRRALELSQHGERADYDAILADIIRRDARDSGRAAAPLRPADDAVTLGHDPSRNRRRLRPKRCGSSRRRGSRA